jgi:tRNA nucleotidyltransferase (CCA-adding enzyme)
MAGPPAMQLYVVGGAVRDALLGLSAADRDWVAVGTTPDELVALGYKPVGRDFPVFLHPQTGEEVALARTERKTAPGYRGFVVHSAPGVTLEEDLARRDLTINAIAQAEDGTLIDPFGGAHDLRAGVLRHVSPAFVEDPVRLLRLARFAARLPTFTVAPQTEALLAHMVAAGEVDALVPERVWQELSRALMAAQPSRFVQVLQRCGALQRVLPGLQAIDTVALDATAQRGLLLPARWAQLAESAADLPALCDRLRVPTDCRELATAWQRERATLPTRATPAELLALLERNDAWRRPERWATFAALVALHHPGLAPRLATALQAAQAVDTAAVAREAAAQGATGAAVGQAVHAARLRAITQAMPERGATGPG